MRVLLKWWRQLSAPALLVFSFVALIAMGTAGFLWLPGLYTVAPLEFLDALFTATSAACVTGLAVVDTATYFTRFGQIWILILIQLGGLGLVSLSTLIIAGMGRRLSLRSEMLALPGAPSRHEVLRLAFAAARFTFAFEIVGAFLLWVQWVPQFGPVGAIWHAVFHSVSAFCNAGFSTFSTSVVGFADSPGILFTLSLLVIAGGIGYLAIEEILRWYRAGGLRSPQRLSTHTFAVLTTTAALLVGGTILFVLFEWRGTLASMGWLDRLANAWFMSVTARTAGFNSVSYAELGNAAVFFTILLMFIGGSPGSTAGGVKTTSLAILIALAWSRIAGKRYVDLHHRSIPDGTVQRAVSLFLLGSGVVIAAVFALTGMAPSIDAAHERQHFLPLMFEAVSAFGTVGLSMDQTPSLPGPGRILVIVLMFLGRVGPLAFFATISLSSARHPAGVRPAREDVVVG